MRELCPSSHTPHREDSLATPSPPTCISRSLPERCSCVSMMPPPPPPPLPSAAIIARRRAADALLAGQWVALAGDDVAILQSWLRLPAMMQCGLLARQPHPTVAGELPAMRLLTSRRGFFKRVLVGMMSLLRRGSLRYVYCAVTAVLKKCIICQTMMEKAKKFSACGGLMRPAARHIFTQKFSSEFLITLRPCREPAHGNAYTAFQLCESDYFPAK